MFVVSRRAARVGTGAATARVFFILRASRGGYGLCCRRPGGARACSGAARRAGETGGPDSHRRSTQSVALGTSLRAGVCYRSAALTTMRWARRRPAYALRLRALLLLVSLQAASETQSPDASRRCLLRLRKRLSIAAGVLWCTASTPRPCPVCRGASNLSRVTRGARKDGTLCLCFYHSAAFPRERFEGADAAVLQSSLHHKELQQI